MARKLLCTNCSTEMSALADRFSEYFESECGISNSNWICDSCDKLILKGDTCCATVLLPNKNHFQYENQKPSVWKSDYLN